jgi:broad specificity phosphatase PhoE
VTRVHVRPSAKTRKRRRRRRAITLSVYVAIVFVLAWYFESQGTTTIIFVRHADIDQSMSVDSETPLNAVGRARAELLAEFFRNVDVLQGLDAIYVSEMARTQQTAMPLAKHLGIEPVVADHNDIVGFMRDVLRDHKREIVLVVTHRDKIAPLVAELHGHQSIPEIASDDYNEVFIVTIPWWGKVKTLQLPYALGWTAKPY